MRAKLAVLAAVGVASVALGVPINAAAAPPTIDAQWVTGVTPTNATIHAEINPHGLLTKYMLQLDTTGNFKFEQNDGCVLHPPGIGCTQAIVPGDPLPPGLVRPTEQTMFPTIESQNASVRMSGIGATLEPNTTYYYRAIAANDDGFEFGPAQTFTTPSGAEPPTIDAQWVTGVTPTNATIHAEINPHGLLTKYMLQLDTTGNFKFEQNDGCVLHPPKIFCAQALVEGDPLPPGLVQPVEQTLSAGIESQHVSVNMASLAAVLQPNTIYYYRAIAANSNGFEFGSTQTFTTPPGTAPPTIDRQWVTDVTQENATLHAEINSNGLQTHYKLQLDTTGNFKFFQTSSCPLSPPGIGCAAVIVEGDPLPPGLVQPPEFILPPSNGSQDVSVNMASIGAVLQPATTYHYRAIAANSLSFVEGPDLTFTTPAAADLPDDGGEPKEPEEEPEPSSDDPGDLLGRSPGDDGGHTLPLIEDPARVGSELGPSQDERSEPKAKKYCRRNARHQRGRHGRDRKRGLRPHCTRRFGPARASFR